MMPGLVMDLDDVSCCPEEEFCGTCGRPDEQMFVATVDTTVGVYCITLCSACTLPPRLPRASVPQTVMLVLAHCQHLGITADQMEQVLQLERTS